jgi:hypothetical protein
VGKPAVVAEGSGSVKPSRIRQERKSGRRVASESATKPRPGSTEDQSAT